MGVNMDKKFNLLTMTTLLLTGLVATSARAINTDETENKTSLSSSSSSSSFTVTSWKV